MVYRRQLFLRSIFIAIFFLFNVPAFAQLSASLSFKNSLKDTSAYSIFNHGISTNTMHSYTAASDGAGLAKETSEQLLKNLDGAIKKPQERKKLLSYLKSIEVENSSGASQAKKKFYYRLANTFARLRLYPLAMKCFLKTVPKPQKAPALQPELLPDTITNPNLDSVDTVTDQYLSVNDKDDSVINRHVTVLQQNGSAVKSKAITYQRIQQTFDDGKKAVAYAMLFHVKQPVRGKRKIFVLNNVGHTFITLIKYNSDSTYTSISLGFYPKKDNLLSATPLFPTTSSVFKNDAVHDWDEVLGKFISKRKFERIQRLILQYDGLKYNLSKNNCTDFGIKAAALAGISIHETHGSWPLGSGNTPAVTGQSILEHKFTNAEQGNADDIFMDSLQEIAQ